MNTLTEFKGWPSGSSKPVLQIFMEPTELNTKYGFVFAKHKDDIEWFLGSDFNDDEIGPVVFMKHENNPIPGTVIHVDSLVDSKIAINRIVAVLDLKAVEVKWAVEPDTLR